MSAGDRAKGLDAAESSADGRSTPHSRLHFGVSRSDTSGLSLRMIRDYDATADQWPTHVDVEALRLAQRVAAAASPAGAQASGEQSPTLGLHLQASGWEQILQRSKRSGGYHVDLPDATDERDTLVLVRVTRRGARAITLTPASSGDSRGELFRQLHIVPALARLADL